MAVPFAAPDGEAALTREYVCCVVCRELVLAGYTMYRDMRLLLPNSPTVYVIHTYTVRVLTFIR